MADSYDDPGGNRLGQKAMAWRCGGCVGRGEGKEDAPTWRSTANSATVLRPAVRYQVGEQVTRRRRLASPSHPTAHANSADGRRTDTQRANRQIGKSHTDRSARAPQTSPPDAIRR